VVRPRPTGWTAPRIEAKRGIDAGLESLDGAEDAIRGLSQKHTADEGNILSLVLSRQAAEHLDKTRRALKRAQSVAEAGLDVFRTP
jgi:hypothetical protein